MQDCGLPERAPQFIDEMQQQGSSPVWSPAPHRQCIQPDRITYSAVTEQPVKAWSSLQACSAKAWDPA